MPDPPSEDLGTRGESGDLLHRAAARDEWRFLGKLLLVLLVVSAAGWTYTFVMGARLASPAVEALSGDEPLGAADLDLAFDALAAPHLFSRVDVPESFLPEDEPVLAGLDPKRVVAAFTDGAVFRRTPAVKAEGQDASKLVSAARAGRLSAQDLRRATAADPAFGTYLGLLAAGFPPGALKGEKLRLCQSFPPCFGDAFRRRHPSDYDSLVVLYRYAKGLPYTERTLSFARRRLGRFIAWRHLARAHGYPPPKGERAVLLALREVQIEALANGRLTTLFFSGTAALLALGLWLTRARRRRSAEPSPDPIDPATHELNAEV